MDGKVPMFLHHAICNRFPIARDLMFPRPGFNCWFEEVEKDVSSTHVL